MRIHANTLTPAHLQDAAARAGVRVHWTRHGSRSRAYAYGITLEGSGANTNTGRYGASDTPGATWDEWGIFLAAVFTHDPTVTIPRVYVNADHFAWATGNRYADLVPGGQHRRHRWDYSGDSVTGSYYVNACKGCGAIRRGLHAVDQVAAWDALSGVNA